MQKLCLYCYEKCIFVKKNTMFIKDDKMSLRIAEPEDAELIYQWENDRRIWRVSETLTPLSRFQIDQFLLSNGELVSNKQMRLMIQVHDEPNPIGCIDLFDYDPVNQRIGIGILIDEGHRHQGYATRAVRMGMEYLFNDVMVHQIHCLIDETNAESQHVFEQLGFQRQGVRKDWIKTPDGYLDTLFYQKINPKS